MSAAQQTYQRFGLGSYQLPIIIKILRLVFPYCSEFLLVIMESHSTHKLISGTQRVYGMPSISFGF